MEIIFGTDGWRGIIGAEINLKSVARVAYAFSEYLLQKKQQPAIVIGYDGRAYSERFASVFADFCHYKNIEVILSDRIVPTPVVSWYVKNFNLDAGVMITASHNPPEYNGIKFKDFYGGPFRTEETLKIEKLLPASLTTEFKQKPLTTDIITPYLSYLKSIFNFNIIKNSDIYVAIDSMGGAGGKLLSDLLTSIEIPNETIYEIPAPDFYSRNPEPIEKNLKPLAKIIKESSDYSFGVATDGDGDRLGVLNEKGEWFSAQDTIMLLTDYLIRQKKLEGSIIKTNSVTKRLDKLCANFNIPIDEVQVGFKYITEKMINTKSIAGFEESGGYGFGSHLPERDGIFSALLLMEMMAVSGMKKLSEYAAGVIGQYGSDNYCRVDLAYEKVDRIELLPSLYYKKPKTFAGINVREIIPYFSSHGIINGTKFESQNGFSWLLIRASETEPILRFYSESHSIKDAENMISTAINQLTNIPRKI